MHLVDLIVQALYGLLEIPRYESTDKKTYVLRAIIVIALLLLILTPFLILFAF